LIAPFTKPTTRAATRRNASTPRIARVAAALLLAAATTAYAQVAIKAATIYTMRDAQGGIIQNGTIVITDGKIAAVGPSAGITIPAGHRVLEAAVATPGLIDAHATVGLTGIFNTPHDSDQLDRSAPIQPELRVIDAYNPQEPLITWVRSFGITTIHTGHAPGELISGQTAIFKTRGLTVNDALVKSPAAVVATLGPESFRDGGNPGTRGKAIAMLREELVKAQEYAAKRAKDKAAPANPAPETAPEAATADDDKDKQSGSRNLRLDMLADVLDKKLPLLITAHRAQDIAGALRLQEEFGFTLILDGAAEAYTLINEIKAAGVPVIVHPTMQRAVGETENLSMETAAKLRAAGIQVAIQSGFESYVPKSRVVLLEAGIAAANGLGLVGALATITIDAAKITGIADRVGSIDLGKDGDIALYSGDPFEYTTRCVGVIIEGQIVSETPR
jgi:imidazolonepropionase-like amidohydrolase